MKELILPVKMPNEFLAYKPFDTSRLSILLAQEPVCKEIYENFLSFRIEKNYYNDELFLECHYNEEFSSVGVKKLPIDLLKRMGVDFIQFCKTSLENHFYLFLPVETSVISNYINYQKKSVPHHLFIYGYNDDSETFYCSEFFSYGENVYTAEEVSYGETEEGFNRLQEELGEEAMNWESKQWMKDIQLLYGYSEYQDRFTIKRIIVGLQYYLSGKDCCGNQNYVKDVDYGFAIYDLLIGLMSDIMKNSPDYRDTRCLKVLPDRFHYMVLQIEFLKENYAVSEGIALFLEDYRELLKISKSVIALCYKSFYKKDYNLLNKVLTKLEILKEKDYSVTTNYIEFLGDYSEDIH